MAGIHDTSASHQRDAARAARNDRIQEVVYLLAWLTRQPDIEAHLTLVDTPNVAMNYIVCIHIGQNRLPWRISDFEMAEYFKHLKTRRCDRGLSRADKMAYLADMLGKP